MDDAKLGAAVRATVLAWRGWADAVDAAERAAEVAEVVEGSRVVDGGQIDPDGSWQVTDRETGELLASGVGLDSFQTEWRPEWVHRDALSFDADESVPDPELNVDLPERLVGVLRDWALERPDEVAVLLDT